MFLRFSTLFSTDGEAPPVGPPAVIAPERWFTIAEGGAVSVVVTQLPLDGGSEITDIEESVNGGLWASLGATAPGIYASTAEPGDTIRLRAVNAEGVASASASKAVNAGYFFSAAVTSTDELNEDGAIERTVTSPAHLAAHDPGTGLAGFFVIPPATAAAAPVVLYPGAIEIDDPASGGTISLTHAPWAVGVGTVSIAYRVMLGLTEVADALPYETSEAGGSILRVMADVTANGVPVEIEVGRVTLAENPLGPVLSGFAIDYDAQAVNAASDVAATARIRRYPSGHVFINEGQEVWDGTGATGTETNEFTGVSGANVFNPVSTAGISGPQLLRIVARVGAGPLSNVIGGPIDITAAGAALTPPNFRGSSIGGFSASSGSIPLPPYEAGDLIELPIGVNCASTDIAGLTATGPSGEVASTKRALFDNGAGGSSGSLTLMYYRAAAANTSGSLTIAITPGGVKSAEQVICTPIARFNVKASGDPYGAVVTSGSSTAVATASTAELTSISAASRIQACFINDISLPPGTAPTGWFMRQFGLIGPHAIQTMSRNDETTAAGQVIAPVSVPLDVARRWTGMAWEVLPLGA